MREMGIHGFCPGPNLSKRLRGKYVYPYLLRDLTIDHPNKVWSVDITYCRMEHGFMYMVAIIDWYSRYIIGYALSNTLEKTFIIETIKKAINKYGAPEIINSDQGSQFTSDEYINLLKENYIKISMDGKGRALDNHWCISPDMKNPQPFTAIKGWGYPCVSIISISGIRYHKADSCNNSN